MVFTQHYEFQAFLIKLDLSLLACQYHAVSNSQKQII